MDHIFSYELKTRFKEPKNRKDSSDLYDFWSKSTGSMIYFQKKTIEEMQWTKMFRKKNREHKIFYYEASEVGEFNPTGKFSCGAREGLVGETWFQKGQAYF